MNVSICSNIEIHQQELSREAIRRSTEHRTFFINCVLKIPLLFYVHFYWIAGLCSFIVLIFFSLQKQFDILRPLYPNMINVDSFS